MNVPGREEGGGMEGGRGPRPVSKGLFIWPGGTPGGQQGVH